MAKVIVQTKKKKVFVEACLNSRSLLCNGFIKRESEEEQIGITGEEKSLMRLFRSDARGTGCKPAPAVKGLSNIHVRI
jgi:hypothetical protein